MNTSLHEGAELAEQIVNQFNIARIGDAEVILAPPLTHLYRIGEIIANRPRLHLAAQNCHQAGSGAYTGEVSASMLRSLGASFVILGHSERRQYFGESDELIGEKVKAVLEADLRPIFCCGEGLDQREAGRHLEVVESQIRTSLENLSKEEFSRVVIAYEPVWAIGTGKTASPAEAQEVHAHIRGLLAQIWDAEAAEACTILYGGSAKPNNAEELFAQADIDGGLIGGASLKADDFLAIIHSVPGAQANV